MGPQGLVANAARACSCPAAVFGGSASSRRSVATVAGAADRTDTPSLTLPGVGCAASLAASRATGGGASAFRARSCRFDAGGLAGGAAGSAFGAAGAGVVLCGDTSCCCTGAGAGLTVTFVGRGTATQIATAVAAAAAGTAQASHHLGVAFRLWHRNRRTRPAHRAERAPDNGRIRRHAIAHLRARRPRDRRRTTPQAFPRRDSSRAPSHRRTIIPRFLASPRYAGAGEGRARPDPG